MPKQPVPAPDQPPAAPGRELTFAELMAICDGTPPEAFGLQFLTLADLVGDDTLLLLAEPENARPC